MSWRYGSIGLAAWALASCSTQADAPPGNGMGSATLQGTIPCQVQDVLQRNCLSCHGAQTQYGAPMQLVTFGDLWAQTPTDLQVPGNEGKPVWQAMAARVHDANSPMPPIPASISAADLATLDSWFNQQAPQGLACGAPPPPAAGGSDGFSGGPSAGGAFVVGGGSGGGTGVGGYGAGGTTTVGGGTGGVQIVGVGQDAGPPPDPNECNYIDFTARSDAAGTPFDVPFPTTELYQCFGFHVDLQGAVQAFSFEPLIDNTNVIHHWLLYQASGPEVTGQSSSCIGFHPDGTLIAGWAPGAGAWTMPQDVGLELTSSDFLLEVHYNNQVSGQDMKDKSGVRMCAGKTARPNTAGISWLGNDAFGAFGNPAIPPATPDATIAGRCRPTPALTAPVHIITSWPHMHKRGRRMTAEIDRAGGTSEMLFDEPFDFNHQWQYATPAIINPGDSILTTCHFDNTDNYAVSFGERTVDEMCFNFTLAYPAHTLIQQTLHNNSCISLP